MVAALGRRGPDGQTTYRRDNIALGHARLSIIDLEGGTQPIFSEDGEIACILNGEIYNYRDLTRDLRGRGHQFRTRSDTESLVHLFEEYGTSGVRRTVGMFAYVIADFKERRLIAYRDRVGEKPLYYIDCPDYFACASEIKALAQLPDFDARLDDEALAEYIKFGWTSAPRSIYRGVRKLLPGSFLVADAAGTSVERYWDPRPTELCLSWERRECVEELRSLIRETLPQKLIADVPTGVLLSGGLDSAAVVAFSQPLSTAPLRSFSAGFETAISELPAARLIADHCGTRHTELVIESDIARDLLCVASYLDEPFADSSCVPTFSVARAAREHVKVVLTGDGGDELFAGYEGYLRQRRYSSNALLRKSVGLLEKLANRFPECRLDVSAALYPLPFSSGSRKEWVGLRSVFDSPTVCQMLGRPGIEVDPEQHGQWPRDPLSQAYEFDINVYLPDDLLKKVDMMSMLCGLEARAPLLDHRLVEFAMRIPPEQKLLGGVTKSILREALEPVLPHAVVSAPKHGFGAPLVSWLSGPVREFAHDHFAHGARIYSLLDEDFVRQSIERSFCDLEQDWRASGRIWTLLMLELWARHAATLVRSD